ncbi:radical SAM protein [Salinispira pacifica]|uniref:radical SAM protein n=1 Tax=Salinispira pacifica TaxID=1307761 RepID=UPI001181F55A|nr:radical SAM protein [Salinispira pacifica]
MVIKPDEISRYLRPDGASFIDEQQIWHQINYAAAPEPGRVREILAKSVSISSLTPEETATLIRVSDPQLLAEMRDAALTVKNKVYDNRIVTFAPLYLSNYCVNACKYCGFRDENNRMPQRSLSMDEVKRETEALAGNLGHKRIIVVYVEYPRSDIDYIEGSIDGIYNVEMPTRKGKASIRRVNVNAVPMDIEKLTRLQRVGVGTYQVFQETYHQKTYEAVIPQKV